MFVGSVASAGAYSEEVAYGESASGTTKHSSTYPLSAEPALLAEESVHKPEAPIFAVQT